MQGPMIKEMLFWRSMHGYWKSMWTTICNSRANIGGLIFSQLNEKYTDLTNLYTLARAYGQQEQAYGIETFLRKHGLIEDQTEPVDEQNVPMEGQDSLAELQSDSAKVQSGQE